MQVADIDTTPEVNLSATILLTRYCDLLGTGVRLTEITPSRVETQLYWTALGDKAKRELYDGYASVQPDEIADLIMTALGMPPHVDVSRLEVFPTDQAVGGGRSLSHAETW
jgi:NADP-dependent 3-hydroxy acid dehydrogenase YdfG